MHSKLKVGLLPNSILKSSICTDLSWKRDIQDADTMTKEKKGNIFRLCKFSASTECMKQKATKLSRVICHSVTIFTSSLKLTLFYT